MTTTRLPRDPGVRSRQNPCLKGLETLMALLALVNLGWVLFDFSYIRFRDLYVRYVPQLAQRYDTIKGIQPHRETDQYLRLVDELLKRGPSDPQTEGVLAQLRDRSVTMITDDPFRIANKSGSLETLKNRMRQHMKTESAKESFRKFWSLQHLSPQNWGPELDFFNRNFRPRMAVNYYRPIDESGDFVDQFWKIDLWFMGCFALDLLVRVLWIRHRRQTRWLDALLWRWYDLLLLLPFWQLLRVIPVAVRLHQVGWLNLSAVQNQVNRNLAENIAGEVTELVLIQTFSVAQDTIKQGALRQLLKPAPAIVDTNQVDELAVLGRRLVEVLSQSVLPQLQPDVEALIHHYVEQAIAQTPVYRTLKPLPGLDRLGSELSNQVGTQIVQTLSATLKAGAEDETGQKLVQQLGQHFWTQTQTGLNQHQTLPEIEALLVDWIEELKLTLVQQLDHQSQPETLAQAESIRRLQQPRPVEVLPKRPSIS